MHDDQPPPPTKATPIPTYAQEVRYHPSYATQPGAVYVAQDDTLVLRIFSPTLSNTVNVSLRYQLPQGQINPEFYTFTVLTAGTVPAIRIIPGAEGYLLSATIETPLAPAGQVYVTLEIIRGQGTGDSTFGQLLISGYPGTRFRIGFPQSPPRQPTEGRGWMMNFQLSSPAPGADFTTTVPTGEQWIVKSVFSPLSTAVAVANRLPSLEFRDGGANTLMRSGASAVQAASLVVGYSWFIGASNSDISFAAQAPLPADFRLQPGWIISSVTSNIQAADQYFTPSFAVERFING